jgi:deferrochelatase/peroxidase EfeB
MLRRGIPYGKEVSDEEKAEKRTLEERGLAFSCYMSSIADGFKVVQKCIFLLVFRRTGTDVHFCE